MAAILKVQCEDEIRRLQFAATPDFEAVRAALRQLWPGSDVGQATYKDDEGDACALTECTFADFLGTSGVAAASLGGRLVLRLQVPRPAAHPERQPAVARKAAPSDAAPENEAPSNVVLQAEPAEDVAPEEEPQPLELPLPSNVVVYAISTPLGSPQARSALRGAGAEEPQRDPSPAAAAIADSSPVVVAVVAATAPAPDAEEPSAPLPDDEPAASTPAAEPEVPINWALRQLGENLVQAASGAAIPASVAAPVEKAASGAASLASAVAPAEEAPREAPAAAADTPPAATAPTAGASGEPTLSQQEKVQIVIAAFDANKDGHLNFEECNDLLHAAWGWRMSWWAYQRLCAHVGAPTEVGLDDRNLTDVYNHNRTLDWDFEVAKRKLEGRSCERAQPCGHVEPCPWYMPLVAGGAVLAVPILAVPLAAVAATRWWRWSHHHHGPCHQHWGPWGHGCGRGGRGGCR